MNNARSAAQNIQEWKEMKAKLQVFSNDTDRLGKELESMKPYEAQEVNALKEGIEDLREDIENEKVQFEEDHPDNKANLKKGVDAIKSIKQADITSLKNIKKAKDIVRLTFDTIQLLFMQPLDPVKPKMTEIDQAEHPFIQDSYDNHAKKMLTGPLLQNLLYFHSNGMDQINEETLELLEPYLNLSHSRDHSRKLFDPEIAKRTSSGLWGVCNYVRAVCEHRKLTQTLQPQIDMIAAKNSELTELQNKFVEAQAYTETKAEYEKCAA